MVVNLQSKYCDFCLKLWGFYWYFDVFCKDSFHCIVKIQNKFEIKLRIKHLFPRNVFQRNKVSTVSDKNIFIFQLNNTNLVTKHRAMQFRYVRLRDKFKHYRDTQVVTVDISQRKRRSKYIKSKLSIILKNFRLPKSLLGKSVLTLISSTIKFSDGLGLLQLGISA